MKKRFIYFLLIAVILVLAVLPFAFSGVDNSAGYIERDISIPIFYAVTLILSVAILVAYIIFMKKKHIWVFLSFVSVCIVNTGYFAFSLSSSISEALLANRISYFGNVYMLLFLSITLANVCGIKYSRPLIVLLFTLSTVMFIFSATQGYLDIFYSDASFSLDGGYAHLIKNYGPMHTAYIIYILLYLALIISTIVYAITKKKTHSMLYTIVIGLIGIVNVIIWFTEQFTENHIEFLSLSYVLNGVLLFWIYYRLIKDRILDSYIVTMTIKSEDSPEKVIDLLVENRNKDIIHPQSQAMDFACFSEEELREIIKRLPAENSLTEREIDVAVLLLKNFKRKDMAANLFVSEETIKTHTSHIYGKLKVSGRARLQELAARDVKGTGSLTT